MRLSSGQLFICAMFGFGGLLLAVIIGMQLGFSDNTRLAEEQREFFRRKQATLDDEGNEVHKMAEFGISAPRAFPADEVTIPDRSTVLGIEADGKYRAYLAKAMSDASNLHIVHDELGGKLITMTYCDRNNCSRAFLRNNVSSGEIMMGGWSGKEMWLMVKNRRYIQSSKKIPMPEYPVEVTTWGEWKKAHPDTDIYLGL